MNGYKLLEDAARLIGLESADENLKIIGLPIVNAVLAELTLGRMSAASSPILCVRNTETGEEVLRIPIADYALLVKGHYRESMGDQEYLDRQDEYPMTLFLDEGEWVSSQIIINGWRVVINNTELN